MDVVTYALAKKYTKDTADTLGSLKGSPCTISNTEEVENGVNVTFSWTGTSGQVQTQTILVKKGVKGDDGEDGLAIKNVEINENSHLICTMSDDSVIDAGDLLCSVLSEDLTATVAIGSVSAGKKYTKGTKLEQIIRDMLVKVEAPAVNLTLSPSTAVYDVVTETVTSITLKANITKKSNAVAKVDFYCNGNLIQSVTEGVADGGLIQYTYVPSSPIKANTTFKVTVTDTENKTANSSTSITFVGKSYYGIVSAMTTNVTETLVHNLTGTVLKTSKTYEYQNITTEFGKVIYCYPASFGALSTIKDEINNLNYTDSFTRSTVTVDNIEYYCYLLTEPTGADGVTLKFN